MATEQFILQWAADHWHRHKTIWSNDFYSLEDLISHNYLARIIAIIKLEIQEQKPSLKLHSNKTFADWLSIEID